MKFVTSSLSLRWASRDFVLAQGLSPRNNLLLPLYSPRKNCRFSSNRFFRTHIQFQPLEQSAAMMDRYHPGPPKAKRRLFKDPNAGRVERLCEWIQGWSPAISTRSLPNGTCWSFHPIYEKRVPWCLLSLTWHTIHFLTVLVSAQHLLLIYFRPWYLQSWLIFSTRLGTAPGKALVHTLLPRHADFYF